MLFINNKLSINLDGYCQLILRIQLLIGTNVFYYFKAYKNYNFSINKEIAVRQTKILRRTIKYFHYSKNLLNINFPQFIVLLIPGLCISPYKGALTLTKLARRQNIINQRKLFQSKNVKTFFLSFQDNFVFKGEARCH